MSFSLCSQTSRWDKIKKHDDILHVYGSLGLTIIGSEIGYNCTKNVTQCLLIGALTLPIVGILGKEYIHDKWLKLGVFSVTDILYDIWGTIIGIIVERCWLNIRGKETVYKDPFEN